MGAILGMLNNPLVLSALGLVVKFVPGIRAVVANRLIPAILTAVAWVSGIVVPADAHAVGLAFGLGGMLGGLGSAVFAAAQSWALNEMFLRHFTPKKPADSK